MAPPGLSNLTWLCLTPVPLAPKLYNELGIHILVYLRWEFSHFGRFSIFSHLHEGLPFGCLWLNNFIKFSFHFFFYTGVKLSYRKPVLPVWQHNKVPMSSHSQKSVLILIWPGTESPKTKETTIEYPSMSAHWHNLVTHPDMILDVARMYNATKQRNKTQQTQLY